jgi:hypothetical protein
MVLWGLVYVLLITAIFFSIQLQLILLSFFDWIS